MPRTTSGATPVAARQPRERAQVEADWIPPMLATLTERRFSDPGWIYERKIDGIRCLAWRDRRGVRLYSRNRRDITAAYPELVAALANERAKAFVVDGEIAVHEGKATSFSRLQSRLGASAPDDDLLESTPVTYYVFDLLRLAGRDTTQLPQIERKELLRRSFELRAPLRYTVHRREHGLRFFEQACRAGWEGLIAKRTDAPYVPRRSRDWLKFKCIRRQELVIGGFTEPQGSRRGFGALLVGYWERGRLRYAGKVGTGYDHALLEHLSARLRRIERAACPFDEVPREPRARWVEPRLVGEFAFTEWTTSGKLRHPAFLGLRPDKRASSVRRERA